MAREFLKTASSIWRRIGVLSLSAILVLATPNSDSSPKVAPVSAELSDAPPAATSELRVAGWLSSHEHVIETYARRYHVEADAVAGVIAYEALANYRPHMWMVPRAVGPGKVHYQQFPFIEGNPAAKQIEELGYLPKRSIGARRRILESAPGAIMYIAALLRAYEDEAATFGVDVRCRTDLLATLYSAWTPATFRHRLSARKISSAEELRPNYAGIWVSLNEKKLISLHSHASRCR